MKIQNIKKTVKFGLLLVSAPCLFLLSCLNDSSNVSDDRNGELDPVYRQYQVTWKEAEKKIDTGDWQAIASGDTLELTFNFTDSLEKDFIGIYVYKNPSDLNLTLDERGDVTTTGDTISFTYPLYTDKAKDTVSLPFELIQSETDTILVIRNSFSTPITEIKYKKN